MYSIPLGITLVIKQDQRLVTLSKLLVVSILLAGKLCAAIPDSPDTEQQQRMLGKIRDSAARYLESLPNFVCSRITERNEGGKDTDSWKRMDTITARIVFNRGKENISLEKVNGKPISRGHVVEQGFTSEGEFGDYLNTILDPRSAAQIQWVRWEILDNRTLGVFEFSVDSQHSLLQLDEVRGLAYHGFLYADPDTGDLWRIVSKAEIPRGAWSEWTETTIQYGWVTIDSKRYVLPVSADAKLGERKRTYWNRILFADYQKFAAESKITFIPGSN